MNRREFVEMDGFIVPVVSEDETEDVDQMEDVSKMTDDEMEDIEQVAEVDQMEVGREEDDMDRVGEVLEVIDVDAGDNGAVDVDNEEESPEDTDDGNDDSSWASDDDQSSDDTWHPDDDESDWDEVDEDAWMVQFYTR